MSAKQLSTKISTLLSEVLASSLKSENDRNRVLEAWNGKKTEVNKLLNNSSRSKPRKDPNAPKKAVSSYICYCNEQRPAVRQKNPNMPITEVAKLLGTMWKALSDKQKEKYAKLANQDKARYENEMKSYTPPEGSQDVQTKGRSRKERTGPKKAMNAYMYFGQAMRPKLKGKVDSKDMMSEIGRLWKELPDDQKGQYEQQALADKQRYESEKNGGSSKKTATSGTVSTATQGATATPAKKGRGGKGSTTQESAPVADVQAPKRGGKKENKKVSTDTPGFESFSNERRSELEEDHPDWSAKKMDSELVKEWTAMTVQERDAYEREAREEDIEEELEDD